MSTRSQIQVLDRDGNKQALIYRHSDGYPGKIGDKDEIGVIPDIMPFLLALIAANGYHAEYLAACLVAYLRRWHCGDPHPDPKYEHSDYNTFEVNGIKMGYLGLGICTELHWDIAWHYTIDKKGVYVRKVVDEDGNGDIIETHLYDDYEMMDGKCISKNQLALAKKKHKISLKDKRLLVEAWRRYHMFEAGTKKNPYLGLGTPSEYKGSKFFESVGKVKPRIKHWWKLTDDGCVAFEAMKGQLEWDKDYGGKIFTGWMPAFDWEAVSGKVVEKRFVRA